MNRIRYFFFIKWSSIIFKNPEWDNQGIWCHTCNTYIIMYSPYNPSATLPMSMVRTRTPSAISVCRITVQNFTYTSVIIEILMRFNSVVNHCHLDAMIHAGNVVLDVIPSFGGLYVNT